MDKPDMPITVDDVLRLVDGIKAKGISAFRWGNIEFQSGPARQQKKRTLVVPPSPEPKNAVDLALDMNGRSLEEDEPSE